MNAIAIKAGIALAILAALGFVLWRNQSLTDRLNAKTAEVNQVRADYAALQTAVAHERKIAKDASDDYESRLQAINVARADTPVRSVRLCRSPTGYVPAPSTTASGTGSPDPAGLSDTAGSDIEAGPDIGPQLYTLADEADRVAAQCNALMGWVGAR